MAQMTIQKKTQRLQSLDFLRGFIMVLLVLESAKFYEHIKNAISSQDSFGYKIITQFFHNQWDGLHFWDLIQPGFMFMAGISMAYSLTKQNSENISRKQQFKKILIRCSLLLFWGIFKRIGNSEWLSLQNLDVTDILTQLAFASMMAFLFYNLKIRYQLVICFGILVLTDLLYRFCSITGFSGGYTDGENFGDYIDSILFGKKTMGYVFVNWFPTAVHTIAGTIVGKLFIKNCMQLKYLVLAGLGLVILGYGLDLLGIIPIIKPIATGSFVMASLGFCFFGVALCYWWIDITRHQKGLVFCCIFGVNSIFIYLFSDIVGRNWFNGYTTMLVTPLLKLLGIGENALLIIASLCIFTAEWGMCYFLYKKKLFFTL